MNHRRRRSARQNGLFQNVFSAHDPHHRIVDLDPVDDRANVGLAERDLARIDAFAHEPGEAIEGERADTFRRTCPRLRAFERPQRRFLRGLQGGDALLQDGVHGGDTLLDEPVETPEPFARILRLARQRRDPPVDGSLLVGQPLGKRGQRFRQPLGVEKMVRQMPGHQPVQLVHADRAPFAGGLALRQGTVAGVIAIDVARS
ncbi:hypothetical protein [Luteitalea sp.]|uniref:hypothetical protein n=1 Tax=Luteitalea sp. TaxID=2004800 RepID=UPI0025BE09FA|nr:hypothetical protein [Luteitalea sp.]